MILMPLMDHRGDATAWADRNSGWVSDRIGNVFALVSFDGVFNQTGDPADAATIPDGAARPAWGRRAGWRRSAR
jgi:hypothetical protein